MIDRRRQIQPVYDRAGTFQGFALRLPDGLSPPMNYKALMLAAEDSGCDIQDVSREAQHRILTAPILRVPKWSELLP